MFEGRTYVQKDEPDGQSVQFSDTNEQVASTAQNESMQSAERSAMARRIAASLNLTRHLTTKQMEVAPPLVVKYPRHIRAIYIYPVIHYFDRVAAIEQVSLARQCGATGVFLLSRPEDEDALVNAAWEAKRIFPDFFVGISLPSKSPLDAVTQAITAGLDMVWADDMGVSPKGLNSMGKQLADFAKEYPQLRLFASMAFSPAVPEVDFAEIAKHARAAGFIPTINGIVTTEAHEVGRIETLSKAVGGELAVSHGVTQENISTFAPSLRHVLMTAGISNNEQRLDGAKLKRFILEAAG